MENTKISLKKGEQEYILEYNRQSVQQIEKMGFSINKIEDNPMIMFPLLFRGAFIKNHAFVKEKEINEIYSKMKKKKELHEKLLEMISETYNELLSDNESDDKEGNVDWEIV